MIRKLDLPDISSITVQHKGKTYQIYEANRDDAIKDTTIDSGTEIPVRLVVGSIITRSPGGDLGIENTYFLARVHADVERNMSEFVESVRAGGYEVVKGCITVVPLPVPGESAP